MNFAGARWAPVSNFPVVIVVVNAIVSMTVQFMAVTRWGPDARTHVLLGATYSPLKEIEYGGEVYGDLIMTLGNSIFYLLHKVARTTGQGRRCKS